MTDRIDDAQLDDDLGAKFARLDRLAAPDIWQQITDLAATPHRSGRSPQRWWAVAAAVTLVVGGVIGVAATRAGDAPMQPASTSAPPVTAGPDGETSVPVTEPDTEADETPFGSATVEPAIAAPGDMVTVTPNGVIQPTCTDIGALYAVGLEGDPPQRLGFVDQNGMWTPEETEMTVPACLPDETDTPITYVLPEAGPTGTVSICRAIDFTEAGCGPLEIVAAPNETELIEMPVVAGLTEGEAVETLRSYDLVVSIERNEVVPDGPEDGRIIAQDPAASTVVEAGDVVSIVVGQATSVRSDPPGQP